MVIPFSSFTTRQMHASGHALRGFTPGSDSALHPLFREENGDPDGVISHLSDKHDYLAHLVHDLAYIIKSNDFDHFLDSLQPLHHAMNRHNKHEEKVFLNLAKPSILMRREEIIARLKTVEDKQPRRVWDF